jgi:prevent-host-death family protein
MRTASVTELKANLSRYLRAVRRGGEVQILERGVPIARLVGLGSQPRGTDQERLERLARAGILRRGTGELGWLLKEPPLALKDAGLSGAVDDEREDRA